MRSKLWSTNMLSGCKRSSSVRHCCVIVPVICHWHKYVFFMACAPHLSFLVVVFPLVMAYIVCPNVGLGGVHESDMMLIDVCCVVCG